jgi:uncharacterized RDD family membrane protein YckC
MAIENNPYQAPASDMALDGPSALAGDAALATRGMRFAGAFIDGMMQWVLILPLQFFAGVYDGFPKIRPQTALETFGWGVLGIVFYLALHSYSLVKSGQTLGKKAVGIRIVNVSDGQQTPFATILTRRLAPQFLTPLIPVVGPVLSLVDAVVIFRKDQRCVHDLIAGTKVIRA